MNERATNPGGDVATIRGLSLSAKFMGLTAALITLLALTASISLFNSARTVREIGSVTNFAIPAYGALARAHIRSLDQAVELRRSLLLAEDPAVSDGVLAEHAKALFSARSRFHQELDEAQRM